MVDGFVLQRADRIKGWMSIDELTLQWDVVEAFKKDTSHQLRFAEIGCFKGRSTYVLASALGDRDELHAVDPFEGILETADGKGLTMGNTLEIFKKNIAEFNNVIVHVSTSEEFNKWSSTGFDCMLIDGLHDYEHVKRDLEMFAPRCSYLMVHDYTGGWPGVVKAVDELIESGTYEFQTQAGSLVVLRRC